MKKLLFMSSFLIGMSAFAQEVKTINIKKEVKDTLKEVTNEPDEERRAELEDVFQYFPLEQQPEYPGGMSALMEYISQNFILPEDYKGEKGKIFVEFVIEKNGKVQYFYIIRGVNSSLDAEAIRVLKSMKDWKAGRNDGKPVRVRYAVPVNIK